MKFILALSSLTASLKRTTLILLEKQAARRGAINTSTSLAQTMR